MSQIAENGRKGPFSMLLTSNRAFDEWGEPFANDLLASAALDRLTHHAHKLNVRAKSYRQRHRLQVVRRADPA
jgi:DNA replication protein DnaC